MRPKRHTLATHSAMLIATRCTMSSIKALELFNYRPRRTGDESVQLDNRWQPVKKAAFPAFLAGKLHAVARRCLAWDFEFPPSSLSRFDSRFFLDKPLRNRRQRFFQMSAWKASSSALVWNFSRKTSRTAEALPPLDSVLLSATASLIWRPSTEVSHSRFFSYKL